MDYSEHYCKILKKKYFIGLKVGFVPIKSPFDSIDSVKGKVEVSTVDGSKASFCDMEGRESELSDLDFRLMELANKALVKEEGWDPVPDPERFLFVILEGRLDSCMVASSLIKFSNFSMLVAITPLVGRVSRGLCS